MADQIGLVVGSARLASDEVGWVGPPVNRRELAWLAIVLGLGALVYLPVVNQPFGRDQGIFAAIADVINRGGLPFRDAWDHKPPGIDYLYALAFRLFGRSWTSVHLVEILGWLAASIAMWSTIRRSSRAAGVSAAGLLVAASLFQFEWWDRGQAEPFIAILSTVGLAILLSALAMPSGQSIVLVAGGVFLGLTVWFKPTAALMPLFGLLWISIFGTRDAYFPMGHRHSIGAVVNRRLRGLDLDDLAHRGAWYLLGVSAGVGLPLLPFILGGATGELWEAVVVFNGLHVQVGSNLTLEAAFWATFEFFVRMGALTPLALVGFLFTRKRAGSIALLGWLLAALAGVWAQGKFFSYHWSVALPPLAGLASFSLPMLYREMRQEPGRAIKIMVSCLVAAAVVQQAIPDLQTKIGRDVPYFLGMVSVDAYQGQFGHDIRGQDVYSFLAARKTADYIQSHTAKSETVLVWGFQALVNWLADRPAPTRYLFSYPLTIDQPASPVRRAARERFLQDLERNRPTYVVLVTNDVNPIQPVDSAKLLDSFPDFKERLVSLYRIERDIDDFHIYRRLDN